MTKENALSIIKDTQSSVDDKILAYQFFADKKDTNAMIALGNLYYSGTLVQKDFDKAKDYYQMAGNNGNAYGFILLGYIYYYGRCGKKDYEEAYRCFMKGSMNKYPEAIIKISDMYLNGYYVQKDEKHAFDMLYESYNEGIYLLKKGQRKNNQIFNICLRYGDAYERGVAVKQNLNKALKYFCLAVYGFEFQMDEYKRETSPKLNYCIAKINYLKKQLTISEKLEIETLLDEIFDHKFSLERKIEEDRLTLNFNFKEREIFIFPEINYVGILKNISFTFNKISSFHELKESDLDPTDYNIKLNQLTFYDEESTLMKFKYENYECSIRKK